MKVCRLCRRYAVGVVDLCPHDGERLEPGPLPPLDPGGSVGGFTVRAAFAAGETGVLLRADRPAPLGGAPALLKVVGAGPAARRDRIERASAVLVPGLRPVEAVIDAGGRPCLVLPFVEGATLAQRLALEGPLDRAAALRLAARIAMAAAGAHAAGLVHGDVRPGHVLLPDSEGEAAALLGDLACPSPPGPFAAPERHRGEEPGEAADVYGVAATLYAALTGRAPFAAGSPRELAWLVLNAPPVPPSVLGDEGAGDPRLDEVVLRALSKDPAARPSMERLAAALDLIGRAAPPETEPPTAVDPTPPFGLVAERPARQRADREEPAGGPAATGLTNVFFRAGEALEQEVVRMAVEEEAGRRETRAAWARAIAFFLLGAGLAAGAFWGLWK